MVKGKFEDVDLNDKFYGAKGNNWLGIVLPFDSQEELEEMRERMRKSLPAPVRCSVEKIAARQYLKPAGYIHC